jgi:hypothetical protein
VEETGVVLFIDQFRMKIMPQISTITIEEKFNTSIEAF